MITGQTLFKSSAGNCNVCRWGNRLRAHLSREPEGRDAYQNGNCTLLAHALRRHLGPEAHLVSVASSDWPKGGEHSAIEYRDHFIDSDGAHQSESYLTRKVRPTRVTWLTGYDQKQTRQHAEHWPTHCREMAKEIGNAIGHPDD